MKRALLEMLTLNSMLNGIGSLPPLERQVSAPSTLNNTQKSKRKKKNNQQKQSRRKNRK